MSSRGPWGHIDPATVKCNDFTKRIYFDYVTPAIEEKNIKARRVEGLSISYVVLESLGWSLDPVEGPQPQAFQAINCVAHKNDLFTEADNDR